MAKSLINPDAPCYNTACVDHDPMQPGHCSWRVGNYRACSLYKGATAASRLVIMCRKQFEKWYAKHNAKLCEQDSPYDVSMLAYDAGYLAGLKAAKKPQKGGGRD